VRFVPLEATSAEATSAARDSRRRQRRLLAPDRRAPTTGAS